MIKSDSLPVQLGKLRLEDRTCLTVSHSVSQPQGGNLP